MPHVAVVVNNWFAKIIGQRLGNTPVMDFSKKSKEAILGGFIGTFVWSVISVDYFADWGHFVCPQQQLTLTLFSNLNCEVSAVYQPHLYELPF